MPATPAAAARLPRGCAAAGLQKKRVRENKTVLSALREYRPLA